MTYDYNSKIYLAEAVFNVKDLADQTAFYTQIIGLEILSQTEKEVILGARNKPLVHLIQTNLKEVVRSSYGLYHMAILLPSREDLADVFKHIAELDYPFVDAADHGYSEALYLEDLEGNGIELYRDKPVAEWDIREDGRIVGVTEELSAQEIYEMGRKVEPFVIAEDTRMGHIHLSVKDSQLASSFYQEVLELADKFTIPTASWIASGDYHHHLAVNEWGGKDLAKRDKDMLGLAYYVVEVEDKGDLIAIAERANNRGAEVKWLSSNALTFEDNDGILIRVRKKILIISGFFES
ncbi:glyoxalase [Streptococcus salivarius]|uniref:VOC family protein n=1 Tax=Streptococcus salivarius TaxID=1304 RepID=UPI0012E19047|nr:VOC family protein [Streptococcus salivarius]MBT1028921.1 VOC family protein [Streptococcus salivarius]QGU78329.1 glyoxalase [Streptococcus salivarius]QGU82350.1 glyoxalase [Streptococcus salivarius]